MKITNEILERIEDSTIYEMYAVRVYGRIKTFTMEANISFHNEGNGATYNGCSKIGMDENPFLPNSWYYHELAEEFSSEELKDLASLWVPMVSY